MGAKVVYSQFACASPVRPVAWLPVTPGDFPFLERIHGHDDALLARLMQEQPGNFPWPEALVS